jgi:catechol-2,3-dioxygenase
MRIVQVSLVSNNLEKMKDFYTNDLEMELLSSTEDSFSVLVGTSKIVFNRSKKIPYYHLCFRTGGQYFEDIFLKLDSKNRLLEDETGQKKMYWKGKQAYFIDPDGNILEVLEREYIGENTPPLGWFDIGEIGLPVSNIKEAQKILSSYIDDIEKRDNDTFAFYGDPSGYLVLVKEGRNWYPTNRSSEINQLEISVLGKKSAEFKLLGHPYIFKIKKEDKID